MSNIDKVMPSWIYKWLVINALVLFYDGGFCVLRPHSLPDGCLGSTVYYGYKLYVEADKHYADPTDSFIFTQGFGNLVEGFICILIVMNAFKTVRLTKLVTLFGSVMTAYKTFLFFLYSFDIGQGGRGFGGWLNEFLVFGLGLVWLLVPLYVIWVVTPDFLDNTVKSSSSLSARKLSNTSYDSTSATSSTKIMNDYVDSGIKTPSVTKTTTQRNRVNTETPAPKTTPSRRYNLRER